MSVSCVQIYCLTFRILTRFIRFTLARRVFIAILLFDVALFGALSILTRKADAKDFAVLVFT